MHISNKAKIAVAAGALVGMALSSPASARDLIYSTFLPSEHHLTKHVFVPFADEVRTKTNNSVNMEVVPGGALAGARETLGAIEDGTIDAGYVIDIYTPSQLPQTALLADLALQVSDARAATAAMNETVLLDCAECRDTLAKHNVVPLGYVSTSTYKLYCTSKVASIADFKGKRFRATSAWAPLIESLGGTPVSVPTSELFEGLQRGAIDCSVGPISHLQSYSLFELVKNVNEMSIGAYSGSLVLDMRKETWDALTDEERATILDVTPKYVAAGIYSYLAEDDAVVVEAKAKGISLDAPADDFKAAYAEHNKAALAAAIAKGKADPSISNPEELVSTYLDNLSKWVGIMQKIGPDQAAYEQALRDEIYSKL